MNCATLFSFLWKVCLDCRTCHLKTWSSIGGSVGPKSRWHIPGNYSEYQTDIVLLLVTHGIVQRSLPVFTRSKLLWACWGLWKFECRWGRGLRSRNLRWPKGRQGTVSGPMLIFRRTCSVSGGSQSLRFDLMPTNKCIPGYLWTLSCRFEVDIATHFDRLDPFLLGFWSRARGCFLLFCQTSDLSFPSLVASPPRVA